MTLTIPEVIGVALGEVLVHGRDLAGSAGLSWRIAPFEARVTLTSILPLAREYVDEVAAAGFSARYDLRIRGGPRVGLVFTNGVLTVDSVADAADCHISAEPVAFLLLSYGRTTPWAPVMRGQIVAWGRRPWLGLKLPRLLRNP